MSRAQLAGVLRIVVEVGGVHEPVLVADQAIRARDARVELDLELYVVGNGAECSAKLVDQHLARLQEVVDVGVVAVAVRGHLLHAGILQVAHAEAEYREVGTVFPLILHELHELGCAGDTDVEVAVGCQDHAVVAALHVRVACQGVRHPDAGATRRAAPGLEPLDGTQDALLLVHRSGRQCHTSIAGVGDDGDTVLGPQLVHEHAEGLLHERKLVGRVHRA